MARAQYYRYNAETDNFERVFPTVRSRITAILRYLGVSLIIGVMLFLFAYYVWDTPGERRLRQDNILLKQQYELLNRRLDNALQVMENIRNRDDNYYRVILQMDPVDDTHRNAGLNNDKRYRELRSMSDGGLVKFMTQRVDLLERQLYAQSLSFDQLKENAMAQKDKLAYIPSRLPVSMDLATISGGYGMRRDPGSGVAKFHPGIDLAAPEGTPVFAAANGTVSMASRKNVFGNVVEIDHGYDYLTRYAHLSQIAVKEGDKVKRGQLIGRVGNTGKSTGPHLHFEVRFKTEAQNPVNYTFSSFGPGEYAKIMMQAENAADVMD